MVTSFRTTLSTINVWHTRIVVLALLVLFVGGGFQTLANTLAADTATPLLEVARPPSIERQASEAWLRACTHYAGYYACSQAQIEAHVP